MTRHYRHDNIGTCSASVEFVVDDGAGGGEGVPAPDAIVRSVRFEGGCSGNLQGISALVEGMTVAEATRRLSGIRCGESDTSCPDQLAKAMTEARPVAVGNR